MAILLAAFLLFVAAGYGISSKSQSRTVDRFEALTDGNAVLTYVFRRPDSASFYSNGHAALAEDLQQLAPRLEDGQQDYYAVRTEDQRRLPIDVTRCLARVASRQGRVVGEQVVSPRRCKLDVRLRRGRIPPPRAGC